MRIAIAQVNPTVGDLAANRALVEQAAERAIREGAEVVILPELVLSGYPPMDLLTREGFVIDQLAELDALLPASREIPIVLGAVIPTGEDGHKQLWNAGVVLAGGKRVATRAKTLLPTYDVFDEKRYFAPSQTREVIAPELLGFDASGPTLGLAVCEDTWSEVMEYRIDPVEELGELGAQIILNPSASPWHAGKSAKRRAMFTRLAKRTGMPIVFVNQFGGNDELIFDGASCAISAEGELLAQLPHFEPAFEVVDVPAAGESTKTVSVPANDPTNVDQLERGLVLGIRDYFEKQNLPLGAVIGVSGGIDSAVTAYLAAEALGADRVLGIAMPGPFSSDHSIDDALELGRLLGIEVRTVNITPVYETYFGLFGQLFGERDDYGLTQQNIQSRIRGATLMAASNYENRLVLATGNKSELSVGYCTLYGDTVGGLAVLGDVYKRDVYAIAEHANRDGLRIPKNTIQKPPSAELAPDQLDTDDLPSYDVLDDVLFQAIELERGRDALETPEGSTLEIAHGIVRRLDRNEYKRRQTPPALRTSTKAFGSGRRLPIVQRYEG